MATHREIKDEELVEIQGFSDWDSIGGAMVAAMAKELLERRRVDRLIKTAWGKDHTSVVDLPALSAAVNAIPQ
jgi:hypothetical protein